MKSYLTDEKCPGCGVNIFQNLSNHVYSEGGKDFQYECSCGRLLDIEVNPVPAFAISLSVPPQVLANVRKDAMESAIKEAYEPLSEGELSNDEMSNEPEL